MSLNSRRKLKPTDAERFSSEEPILFMELAKVICSTGVLPRKELYECWQMAICVNKVFPECLRVADLAAGHGLLAWILVLLARTSDVPILRTAVAVDIKRPKSAEALAGAIIAHWPNLTDAVHYVEGSIDSVTAEGEASTLFVAVHACGSLSDRVLLAAIKSRSPVAIMPCCHSLRKQTATLSSLAVVSRIPAPAIDDIVSSAVELGPSTSIDQFRIKALASLGYHISEDRIQPEITRFNRIIMAQHSDLILQSAESVLQSLDAGNNVNRLGETRAFETIRSLNVAQINEARELSKRPSREWRRSFDLSYWVHDESVGQRLATALDVLTRRLLHLSSLESRAEADEEAQSEAQAVLEYFSSGSAVSPRQVDDAVVSSVTILDRYSDLEMQRLAFTYRIKIMSLAVEFSKADAILLRSRMCAAVKHLACMLPEKFEWRGE